MKITFAATLNAAKLKAATLTSITATLALFASNGPASAFDLYTGDRSGLYHQDFCPTIQEAATKQQIVIDCRTSNGSLANLEQVRNNPANFGLTQYDIFASKYADNQEQSSYIPVRDDIGKECLFMITKNKLISNMGDVASSAPYMKFILPPQNSGHAGTFNYLQKIDSDGLGKATNVTYAPTTEDAILKTLSSEDGVSLFVQFPDPDSKIFKLVNENGGHFIPVISKEILSQSIKGRKVYSAEETAVSNPKWHKSGEKLVTTCTPLVLFTGQSNLIIDAALKNDHESAITALQKMPVSDLQPEKPWFKKLWTGTKAVSATSVETLVKAADDAKKATSPYLEKAKEVTEDAIEATKPTYEAAKEKTKEAMEAIKPTYEAAKEKTKEALEAAKPTYEAAKEKTKEALEAAKPTYEAAKESTKSYFDKAVESVSGWFSSDKPEEPEQAK